MSNNIEFISAADLPTTDAKEVDVLCVENGELKLRAGAGLGGGGGSFVMRPALEELVFDEPIVCSANYDELAKALEAGSHASIVFPAGMMGDGSPDVISAVLCWGYMEGQGLFVALSLMGEHVTVVFTNGTYVPTIG